ncbi:tRNA dihydrouridine(20/20a) synthase DusA [Alphaproteobacteria bacterium]|nr:tRNA dihydrouridine(20/20a) synthase DusA [Alphaproteobacteria bacterium]
MSLSAGSYGFCVAPMMEWTDRHERFFLRLISRHARLYTEMLTAPAVLHGDRDRLLGFDPAEQPLAVQLGGADAAELAEAARICADYGYDEINLNVGCPSDRVQSGRFGACLMREPATVARAVSVMAKAVDLPVTVKCRIGVDEQDENRDLDGFIDQVADAGCTVFIVHARKAWLKGLSPKENRDVPPLNYARVHALKARRPELTLVLNGGLMDLAQAQAERGDLDGVMLGRAAYQDPWVLAGVDQQFFAAEPVRHSRQQVITDLVAYTDRQMAAGVPLKSITRHLMGLFNGLPGARAWRRHLSVHAHQAGAGPEVIFAAAAHVSNLAEAA